MPEVFFEHPAVPNVIIVAVMATIHPSFTIELFAVITLPLGIRLNEGYAYASAAPPPRIIPEGFMNTASKLAATLVGAATVVAFVGCSSSHTATSSGTPTSSATTTAGQSASSSPPQGTSSASPAPGAASHGSAGGVDVTITAPGPTTVRPGGPPMPFSVTLVNTTTAGLAQVGMVVSLGHCSCNPSGAAMMPAGSMQMLNTDTNAWVTVPYVAEGTGTDFLSQTLVPPFVITQGQTITYQLQLQLNANQNFTVGNGASAIDVTMTNVTTNTALGVSPTASLPIAVEP